MMDDARAIAVRDPLHVPRNAHVVAPWHFKGVDVDLVPLDETILWGEGGEVSDLLG